MFIAVFVFLYCKDSASEQITKFTLFIYRERSLFSQANIAKIVQASERQNKFSVFVK